MATAIVNEATVITVTFRQNDIPTDPDTVEGSILDSDEIELSTFPPTRVSEGVYRYVWTPTSTGTFFVRIVGTYDGGAIDTVQEEFLVSTSGSGTTALETLGEDQFLNFMPQLDPLYIGVDDITTVYPSIAATDAAEYIYYYSLELDELLGSSATLNTVAYEYLRAAVLCSLSKIYDLGAVNAMSMVLGDLSISNQQYGSSGGSRGNASTWCELAAVLRRELNHVYARTGMKAVVKGSAFANPIPVRGLRSRDN